MTFRGILDSVMRLWGSEGGKNEGSQEQQPGARHGAGHVCLAFDEEARGNTAIGVGAGCDATS